MSFPAHAVAVSRDVCYHNVACFTFLTWHCLLTFDQDVQYIWTMRNKNPLKWVYFFFRYVSILAFTMHSWLVAQLVDGSNPSLLCNAWRIYTAIFPQMLASLLEFILAARIFALYNQSGVVAFVLSILIVMEFSGTMRMLWLQKSSPFYQTCLLIRLTGHNRNQSILMFTVHCVLVALTLFKYFSVFKPGRNSNALAMLVVRDGSTMYAIMLFIFLSLVLMCGFGNGQETIIFFWVVSLFSISGCRMILSMERFARREISIESPQAIFTSHISMGTADSGKSGRINSRSSSIITVTIQQGG